MNYRHDIAEWQKDQIGITYRALAESAGLATQVIYETVRGKTSRDTPANPQIKTIKATFEALGLDPKYALDFKLKKSQFRRAVNRAAR